MSICFLNTPLVFFFSGTEILFQRRGPGVRLRPEQLVREEQGEEGRAGRGQEDQIDPTTPLLQLAEKEIEMCKKAYMICVVKKRIIFSLIA